MKNPIARNRNRSFGRKATKFGGNVAVGTVSTVASTLILGGIYAAIEFGKASGRDLYASFKEKRALKKELIAELDDQLKAEALAANKGA